jgi:hypothetical protein
LDTGFKVLVAQSQMFSHAGINLLYLR